MKAIDLKHACIERISSRKDRSLSFGCSTPELTPEQAAAFLALHGINVRILIQPIDLETDAFIEVKAEKEAKTQAQRLRAVLFVLWRQTGKQGDFEDFYRKRMDLLIDGIKKKLEPEP